MIERDPTRTTILRENFAQNIRKVFRDERMRIIALFEQDKLTEYEIDKMLDTHEMQKIITKRIGEAFYRGENYANQKITKATGIPAAQSVILPEHYAKFQHLVGELITNMTQEQKGRVASTITRGLLAEKTRKEIAQEISDTFDVAFNRANKIARNEILRTFNYAAKDRYKNAGSEYYSFLAHIDERTTDMCKGFNNKIFKFDEGPIPPDDTHIQCRSTMIPIFKKVKFAGHISGYKYYELV